MKTLLIYHHLGLGDHIINNGLVHELLKRHNPDVAWMPVKHQNFATVRQMYLNEPKIVCVPVQGDQEVAPLRNILRANETAVVGFHYSGPNWDKSFYADVGIPFEKRITSFKCYRDFERENQLERIVNPTGEPFILVHDQASTGKFHLPIDNHGMKRIEVRPVSDINFEGTLMDWCGLIYKAKEIHCVDSSFIHLCISLGVAGIWYNVNKSGFGDDPGFYLPDNWQRIKAF